MEVCERHRPQRLEGSDFVGNYRAVQTIKAWFAHRLRGAAGPGKEFRSMLLLSGPPGVGKTTAVLCLAARHKLQLVEINGSDDRGEAAMRDLMASFKGRAVSVTGRRCVFVIEEADGLTGPAAGVIIKHCTEVGAPLVCVCNNPYAAGTRRMAEAADCTHVRMQSIRPEDMTQRVIALMMAMGVRTVSRSTVQDICGTANGDMRRCVHLAEAFALGHRASRTTASGALGGDRTYNPFDAARILLSGRATADVRRQVVERSGVAMEMVHANYMAIDGADVFTLCDAAEQLSAAAHMTDLHITAGFAEDAVVAAGRAACRNAKTPFSGARFTDLFAQQSRQRAAATKMFAITQGAAGPTRHAPSHRTVATELVPLLTASWLKEALRHNPSTRQWYLDVVRAYGINALRDKASDAPEVVALAAPSRGSAAMPGFVRTAPVEEHAYTVAAMHDLAFAIAPPPRPPPQGMPDVPGNPFADTLPAAVRGGAEEEPDAVYDKREGPRPIAANDYTTRHVPGVGDGKPGVSKKRASTMKTVDPRAAKKCKRLDELFAK